MGIHGSYCNLGRTVSSFQRDILFFVLFRKVESNSPMPKANLVFLIATMILVLIIVGVIAISLFDTRSLSSTGAKNSVASTSLVTTVSNPNSTLSGVSVNVISSFTFNNSAAINFFEKLDTPTGLLETFVGSKTIFLSDDQALDYSALIKLGDSPLAQNITTSISSNGGLYQYWNAVFALLGQFPSSNQWDWSGSGNYKLTNASGYEIWSTIFNGTGMDIVQYEQYADLALYYSYYCLKTNQYASAWSAFEIANSYWNGNGFVDRAYLASQGYDSYKLAIDLFVFKALMANPNTEARIASYNSTITQVQAIMSKLQGSDGGVATNYQVTSNGNIAINLSGVYENGETTSLFVLAK
jgi:biopolymer transport protein ExbD